MGERGGEGRGGEGWGGRGGVGREGPTVRGTGIHMADSRCTAETNTTL